MFLAKKCYKLFAVDAATNRIPPKDNLKFAYNNMAFKRFAFIMLLLYVCHFAAARQKLVVVLADGLRWDRYGYDLPNLMEVEKNGIRADWMDGAFVTMSTPAMYSIATGLYPETHGAIHNLYFDPVTRERTVSYGPTLNKTEWFDTGAEPVWVTAILQGLSAATIMYPGGTVPIKGIMPNRTVPYARYFTINYKMKERVNDTVKWLKDDDFDLVFLYFEHPDEFNHLFGIGSVNATAKLFEVDDCIGYLFQRLAEEGLDKTTNVIIASDHGHINVDTNKYIILNDYVDFADIDFLVADYGPTFQLVPAEGTNDTVYNALKDAHPAMTVYKKEDIPDRFHYRENSRILPIFGFVDPGWHLHSVKVGLHPLVDLESDHGYDNKWMVMKSSFYAQGPYFRKNYRAPPLESVLGQVTCATLAYLAYDRLRIIGQPLKSLTARTLRKVRVHLIAIWIGSLILHIPSAFIADKAIVCIEFNRTSIVKIYVPASVCVNYIIPFVIIVVCYLKIWRHLSNRPVLSGEQKCNQRGRNHLEQQSRNLILKVIMFFAICWLPINCIHLWVIFHPEVNEDTPLYALIHGIGNVMMYVNQAGNPFLYALGVKGFQTHLMSAIHSCSLFRKNRCSANNNIQIYDIQLQRV